MRILVRLALAIFFLAMVNAQPAYGADSVATLTLHEQIQQAYNFHPHELDQQQIKDKSIVLDQFWTKAKNQQSIYLPGLRRELADFDNPKFFLYDGGKLLLSLSDTPQDRKIIIAAFMHCDLRDVQQLDYFLTIHRFAVAGEDTTQVALRILEEPKFRVFIARHVMWLTQADCLVYLLMPIHSDYWMPAVSQRLKVEQDETAQKSLLLLLLYVQTSAADRMLAEFADDSRKPAGSRDYAKQLINLTHDINIPDRLISLLRTEWSIRRHQREVLRRPVSDEAMSDFQTCTAQLAAKRARWWLPL